MMWIRSLYESQEGRGNEGRDLRFVEVIGVSHINTAQRLVTFLQLSTRIAKGRVLPIWMRANTLDR